MGTITKMSSEQLSSFRTIYHKSPRLFNMKTCPDGGYSAHAAIHIDLGKLEFGECGLDYRIFPAIADTGPFKTYSPSILSYKFS